MSREAVAGRSGAGRERPHSLVGRREGGEVVIAIGSLDKANGQRRRQGVIDELLERSFEPLVVPLLLLAFSPPCGWPPPSWFPARCWRMRPRGDRKEAVEERGPRRVLVVRGKSEVVGAREQVLDEAQPVVPDPDFVTPVPVRWSDIDMYQHVNHATMVTMLEEARSLGCKLPLVERAFTSAFLSIK